MYLQGAASEGFAVESFDNVVYIAARPDFGDPVVFHSACVLVHYLDDMALLDLIVRKKREPEKARFQPLIDELDKILSARTRGEFANEYFLFSFHIPSSVNCITNILIDL